MIDPAEPAAAVTGLEGRERLELMTQALLRERRKLAFADIALGGLRVALPMLLFAALGPSLSSREVMALALVASCSILARELFPFRRRSREAERLLREASGLTSHLKLRSAGDQADPSPELFRDLESLTSRIGSAFPGLIAEVAARGRPAAPVALPREVRALDALVLLLLAVVVSALGVAGWQAATRRLPPAAEPLAARPRASVLAGEQGMVESLALSRQGRHALSGGADGTVILWDLEHRRPVHRLRGHKGGVTSVDLSPDGQRGLSGSFDGTVRLWDLRNGREVRSFPMGERYRSSRGVAFLPDGERAVVGIGSTGFRLVNLATGKARFHLTGAVFFPTQPVVSPRGDLALSAYDLSGRSRHDFGLIDLVVGRSLRRFPGHDAWVLAFAFSPDGRRVVSGSADRTARSWDVATGRSLAVFQGHEWPVVAVVFSEDGRQVLSGDGRTLRTWDADSGAKVRMVALPRAGEFARRRIGSGFEAHEIGAMVISPDGRRALASGAGGSVLLWDLP